MSRLDPEHLARIRAVLEVLVDYPVARAALICEDAFVAIALGLSLGLTMKQIAAEVGELLTEDATPRFGPM